MLAFASPLSGIVIAIAVALAVSTAALADDLGDDLDDANVLENSDAPSDADATDALTADEIYSRVLDNRFQTSAQELVMQSGDRVGREQTIRMQMLWKRYESGPQFEKGIQSRTVVRYMEPTEMRRTGYLIINKADLPSDQFVYLNSMRRIRRINLRGESVVGTDLSLEDIVPREMDDATYTRIPNESVNGTPCFVIEAMPKHEAKSDYLKFRLFIERDHYVALRIRYWDRANVAIKELMSPVESIREFDGIYVPIRSTMRHLLDDTYTNLRVDMLVANPELANRFFTQRQLEAKKLRLPSAVIKAAQHFEGG
jgi:hypothetical protein